MTIEYIKIGDIVHVPQGTIMYSVFSPVTFLVLPEPAQCFVVAFGLNQEQVQILYAGKFWWTHKDNLYFVNKNVEENKTDETGEKNEQ